MKTTICITAAVLALTSMGHSKDKLPLNTEILLQKLVEWEAEEIASYEKNVQQKRKQVAVTLKSHLKRATQSGNLKTANLIQTEIDKLTSPVASATTVAATTTTPNSPIKRKARTDREIKSILSGHKWKPSGGNPSFKVIVFKEDDTLDCFTDETSTKAVYTPKTRIENRTMQYWHANTGQWQDIEISEDEKEISMYMGSAKTFKKVTYKK